MITHGGGWIHDGSRLYAGGQVLLRDDIDSLSLGTHRPMSQLPPQVSFLWMLTLARVTQIRGLVQSFRSRPGASLCSDEGVC